MTTQLVNQAVTKGDISAEDLTLLTDISEIEAEETYVPLPSEEALLAVDGDAPGIRPLPSGGPKPVYLRRVTDGQIKKVPRTMLASKLRQRLPDGRKAWLNPKAPWKQQPRKGQNLPCFFSRKHPDFDLYQSLGMPICERDSGLPNRQAQVVHAKNRHELGWPMLQAYEQQGRDEGKEALLLAALKRIEGRPAPRPRRKYAKKAIPVAT